MTRLPIPETNPLFFSRGDEENLLTRCCTGAEQDLPEPYLDKVVVHIGSVSDFESRSGPQAGKLLFEPMQIPHLHHTGITIFQGAMYHNREDLYISTTASTCGSAIANSVVQIPTPVPQNRSRPVRITEGNKLEAVRQQSSGQQSTPKPPSKRNKVRPLTAAPSRSTNAPAKHQSFAAGNFPRTLKSPSNRSRPKSCHSIRKSRGNPSRPLPNLGTRSSSRSSRPSTAIDLRREREPHGDLRVGLSELHGDHKSEELGGEVNRTLIERKTGELLRSLRKENERMAYSIYIR